MKKPIKSKKSSLSQINNEDFNFSHIGKASQKQFLYLLDKKKDIDNLYQNKKERKIETHDIFEEKEKDFYDDDYEKDEYEDNIFDKSYEARYKKELKEKKDKYPQLRNSCSCLDINNKQGNIKNKKKFGKKNKEETKASLDNINYEMENGRYKYHLIHHKHDYIINKSSNYFNNNNNQVSSNSYKPKLEFIFKKIIYSPEFAKMSGRFDQENKKNKIENKIDEILKTQKQKEFASYQRQLKKIRNLKLVPLQRNESEENFFLDKRPIKKFRTIDNNNDSKKLNSEFTLRGNSNDNGENINDSRNGIINLGKRNNSVLMNEPKYIEFNSGNSGTDRLNKGSNIPYIKNIEDYEKKNISNKLNENTLSTIDNNRTVSSRKKQQSNYDTEIIYPNISKNDSNSNMLIDNNYNNYSLPYKRKKSFSTLNNINYLVGIKKTDQTNNSNLQPTNYFLINKKFENNSDILPEKKRTDELSKVVNFEKMLSREYINKLKKQTKNIYGALSPKYDVIKPRCIMKVIYEKKNRSKKYIKKEFKSDYNQIVFNIDKYYNNYNNHFPPKNIFLGKITGRRTDTILPTYMLDQYNRNSFNTFNEKSLKMNNFANGEFLPQKSSFNDKRTFNYKLIDQYTGNDYETLDQEIHSIFRRITKYPISNKKNLGELRSNSSSNIDIERNRNNNLIQNNFMRTTKIPEYYQVNLDKYGKYPFSCGEKIDGFTLKTIKSSKSAVNLLSEHEKKIFLSKLDE